MACMQALPPRFSCACTVWKYASQYSRPTASNISIDTMASNGPSGTSR